MCLAIPGRVIEVDAVMAQVDFGGVRRRIGTALVPELQPGDYVLVHAGFAIQIIDFDEAQRQLALIREIDDALIADNTIAEADDDA